MTKQTKAGSLTANSVRRYKAPRVRGLADWRPQRKTLALLDQVKAVLDEYRIHLPLTCRQVFYRLVGAFSYDKTEQAYDRLLETMNRARRSRVISFDAIRDDGIIANEPTGFYGLPDFFRTVRNAAANYRRDRMANQDRVIEVWVEAGGMVPQAVRVAHHYGTTVYSSGGFDSLTVKYDAAKRILARDQATIILHVGDYDPSGLSIFDSASADVTELVANLASVDLVGGLIDFRRVVVTPEQIAHYGLPEAPAKATDRRGDWQGGTVQAEALAPDELATELRNAIEAVIDQDKLAATLEQEEAERHELLKRTTSAFGEVEGRDA